MKLGSLLIAAASALIAFPAASKGASVCQIISHGASYSVARDGEAVPNSRRSLLKEAVALRDSMFAAGQCVPSAKPDACEIRRTNGFFAIERDGQRIGSAHGSIEEAVAQRNDLITQHECELPDEIHACSISLVDTSASFFGRELFEMTTYHLDRPDERRAASRTTLDEILKLRRWLIKEKVCNASPAANCDILFQDNKYAASFDHKPMSVFKKDPREAIKALQKLRASGLCRPSAPPSHCKILGAGERLETANMFVVIADGLRFTPLFSKVEAAEAFHKIFVENGVCENTVPTVEVIDTDNLG